MKNFLSFLIILVALAAGAGFMVFQREAMIDELTYEKKLQEQRVNFARQAALTIQTPEECYSFDRNQLVADHVAAVERIWRQHPEQANPDQFIEKREAAAKEGKKDKARVAEYRESYDYLRERFGVLKAGYKPVLTAFNNGVRYDIVAMSKTNAGGKESLRWDLFVWGAAPGQLTFGGIEIQFLREIKEVDARGKEKVKKAIAKVTGQGPPFIFHENAWEWIPEWPPVVSVGHYQGLPLFPADATKFTLKLDLTVRTAQGTTMPVELKWENVEVSPSWRAPEGALFEADVMPATDEELEAAGITP